MPIIIHPEYENLKNKLSKLIFRYNNLKYHVCPNIERNYVRNFGLLEYELYKQDVELSKIKRKLKLIQIKINNNEKIDIDWINQQLEKEFSIYEQNIAKQMEELDKLLNSNPEYLSKEDAIKLKAIYKKCVFALHPDVNDNVSQDQLALFTQINEAFKNSDLNMLESLYLSIPNYEMDNASDLDRLDDLIKFWENKIKELKESYPYNKKGLLDDEDEAESYKEELKVLINQFKNEINSYQEKIISMI